LYLFYVSVGPCYRHFLNILLRAVLGIVKGICAIQDEKKLECHTYAADEREGTRNLNDIYSLSRSAAARKRGKGVRDRAK